VNADGTLVCSQVSFTQVAGGTLDASAATSTLPIKTVTIAATPTSCSASKELIIVTDAPAGQQLFVCNATSDGWVLVGDGAPGASGDLATETAARISADNTLTSNLNSEISNRQSADTTLQNNIDALSSSLSSYVDLSSSQTISGTKTFSSTISGSITGTASNVTGTVAVGNGGTGLTASGASGNILMSNGSTWVSTAPSILSGNYVDLTSDQSIAGAKTFTGSIDASTAAITIPIRAVTGAPLASGTSCAAGKELVIRTDPDTPGQQIYVCNPSGTGWILQGDGLGSGGVVFNQVVIQPNKMVLTKNACSATYSTPGLYPQQNANEDLPVPTVSGANLSSTSTLVISPVSTFANSMPMGWTSYTYYPYVDSTGKAFVHVCNPTQFNAVTSGQITFNVRAIN
jgi:hypothetical protein